MFKYLENSFTRERYYRKKETYKRTYHTTKYKFETLSDAAEQIFEYLEGQRLLGIITSTNHASQSLHSEFILRKFTIRHNLLLTRQPRY